MANHLPLSHPDMVPFPEPEEIESHALAFAGMMFAHAAFEREVSALQDTITQEEGFGERWSNQWSAHKRPAQMAELIVKHRGQLPETETIKKLLTDAIDPSDQRNLLAHGTWCGFNRRTAKIHVRGATRRQHPEPPEHRQYTADEIQGIAGRFADIGAELFKLRRSLFPLPAEDGLQREALPATATNADDKAKKVADHSRIDLREPYELAYWSRRFGVSREQLADVIHKVGTNAEDVAIAIDNIVDLKINHSSRMKGGTVAVVGLCVLMIGFILLVGIHKWGQSGGGTPASQTTGSGGANRPHP